MLKPAAPLLHVCNSRAGEKPLPNPARQIAIIYAHTSRLGSRPDRPVLVILHGSTSVSVFFS